MCLPCLVLLDVLDYMRSDRPVPVIVKKLDGATMTTRIEHSLSAFGQRREGSIPMVVLSLSHASIVLNQLQTCTPPL